MEPSLLILSPLTHQTMNMRMKIDPVAEGLDARNHTRHKLRASRCLEVFEERSYGRMRERSQEPALVLEENPQHLGNCEDHLSVRNIQKECLSYPLAPLLQPLGMTRGAEAPGAAGKHQESLVPTVRTANPSKSAARVATIQITLHDLLDDKPEVAIFLLEAALILSQKLVEVMKQHPIEHRALRMTRTVDSWHRGKNDAENEPGISRNLKSRLIMSRCQS